MTKLDMYFLVQSNEIMLHYMQGPCFLFDWIEHMPFRQYQPLLKKNYRGKTKNNNQKQRCMLKSGVGIDYFCLYIYEYVSLGILL